jgi:hypothetical protein
MRVILDESTPKRLKHWLQGHEVRTAIEMGWGGMKNGPLLRLIQGNFDLFVTADKNIEHQQNLAGLSFGILVLPTNRWGALQPYRDTVAKSLSGVAPARVIRIG